jgi:hypothetical protein
MTAPRRQRARAPEISDLGWALLNDLPPPDHGDAWERMELASGDWWSIETPLGKLWAAHRDAILPVWVVERPGCRPRCWWRFTAPRMAAGVWPGFWFDGQLPEPRRRLGGTGLACHECLANIPRFELGLPVEWLDAAGHATFARIAREDGQDFAGVAVDACDPPRFEAQAAYLERHGLLLPGERKRLRRADFEPETVVLPGRGDA